METLWPLIFGTNQEIYFAHSSFKWANLASHNAGVTVAIVCICSAAGKMRRLFTIDGDGKTIVKETENINAYLAAAPNIVVKKSSRPISELTEMSFGNMPNDGGYLLLGVSDAEDAVKTHHVDQRFIRPFFGSQEFIRGTERRCIWVHNDEHEYANANAWLNGRFEEVRNKRAQSDRSTTKQLAEVPFRFGEVRQTGDEIVTIIPSVSSEGRDYLPVGVLPRGSIVSNLAFAFYDAPIWNMAIVASTLHYVWIKAICGQLETRIRYSNTLGWNTFPVAQLTEKNKADLTRCAEDILLAREAHFPATIAELYDPEQMPDDLREAHERNDEVLERIYIGRRFKNDTERLEKLFELYTEMTSEEGSARERKVEAQ